MLQGRPSARPPDAPSPLPSARPRAAVPIRRVSHLASSLMSAPPSAPPLPSLCGHWCSGRRLASLSDLPSSAGRWRGPGALTHHGRPAADAARAASAPDRPPRAGPPRWPPVGPATALPPARPLPRQRRGASLGTCLTGVLLLAFQMFLSPILPLQLRRSWPRPVLFPCDSLSHTSSPLIPQVRAHQLNNFC